MVGIFSFLSPRYAQFIYKYTNILDDKNIEYEVIYWNREGIDYKFNSNWIGYNKSINTFQPFYKKILGFLGFTSFMYKILKKKKYHKLIILTTQTAIPLFPLLCHKYAGKYVYDYRDITYENICFYKRMVNKLVNKSYFTSVSSNGFLDCFLNKMEDKYVLSHNSRNFTIDITNKRSDSDKIRIVYWGMIRQLEFNYKICDLFANDNRIELIYHGAGFHKELQEYCEKKNYKNIKLTGAYKLEDINDFVINTDFVLNSYENDKQQKPAMTVKYYDGLKYGIPMIVTKDSYMGNIVEKKNLGIAIDWDKENIETIYDKIKKFDFKEYNKERKIICDEIIKDDIFFEKKLLEFLKGK